ncbi:MAG: FecR domain-containing protein [Planctomycetes bacterium]|nr:FecR domain-containing protein [Planctomycetota bacterium]
MRRTSFTLSLTVVGVLAGILSSPSLAVTTANEARAEALRQAAEELREETEKQVQPLAEGQTKVLKAVVMQVKGRAQWRTDAKAKWKKAAVKDVLEPGAMIRTGSKSYLALRVGHNASVLVDRSSRVTLPEIVHAGETLRTTVQIKRGRADFKVDRVGLTNDFSVVTPSTTLAVRGTAMGVDYGGFGGTKITAARTNALKSIEVTFLLNQATFSMSGGGTSSDDKQNPVESGLGDTGGPDDPGSEGGTDPTDTGMNPENRGTRQVDTSVQTMMAVENLPIFEEDPVIPPDVPDFEFPDFPGLSFGEAAEFICDADETFSIFSEYDFLLNEDFPSEGEGFSFPGLDQLYFDVDTFCFEHQGPWLDQDLVEIVSMVQAFCETHFTVQEDVNLCVSDFAEAVISTYEGGQSPP